MQWSAANHQQQQLHPKQQQQQEDPPPAASPAVATPTRKRGCNCKKSGCLKLYCECFTANARCGDRCQCMGCKNREHNRLEIAHAIQAIEKRTQKTFRSPASKKIESFRHASVSASKAAAGEALGSTSPAPSFAARSAPSNGAAAHSRSHAPRKACSCQGGICTSECPCLLRFGGCEAGCPCKGCRVLQLEKTKGCSCKKSNCLKLYCECLAAQRVCDSRCNCEGCKNRLENQEERDRAVTAILERNPLAFQPKVATGTSQHLRGCNCRKSGCMKNYCECHQAGVPCTSRCACHQCRNTEMFDSAKKILVLRSPNDDVGSERLDSEQPRHAKSASAASSMTPPRRVLRKASLDATPLLYTPVRTQGASAALELLSRSAPPASRPDYFARASTTPTKRAVNGDAFSRPATERSKTPPLFTKRKHPRVSARPLFLDRIEEVDAAERLAALPSIDGTLEQDFGGGGTSEPALAKLCRSLLHAATTVGSPAAASLSHPTRTTQHSGDVANDSRRSRRSDQNVGERDVVMAEVGADDLLCEELIETSNDHLSSSSSSQDEPPIAGRAKNRSRSIAAAQERAVLQEVSVWLRNIATAALPTNGAASSRQF